MSQTVTTSAEGMYDVAVVGAGIVGLAHAYHAARRGLRVVVLERSPQAEGASIRNFGLIWPIGQAAQNYSLALRSRELWIDVLRDTGLYHRPTGSLHLAYREDEAAVGQEFARLGVESGYGCEWLGPREVLTKTAAVRSDGLLGALWSATELMIDPRQFVSEFPRYLSKEFNVQFRFGASIRKIAAPEVWVGAERFRAKQIVVCSGSELNAAYSEQLGQLGLNLCKLQMMRTAPQPRSWQLGPALAGGLTFRFYPAFEVCRSLKALRECIARETPALDQWIIHTMISQGADGSLVFGDSHEYGPAPSPFLRAEIDELILGHIRTYLSAPNSAIAERWYGVYAKHPTKAFCHAEMEPGVLAVTGFGGAGMTLSFGVAEQIVQRAFD
jgi:D-hydroxyproline dehydrogenase subunit beta